RWGDSGRRGRCGATRRPRGDDSTSEVGLGRTCCRGTAGRDEARGIGTRANRAAHGLQPARIDLFDPRLVHGLPTEAILANRHHRVLHADVLVDVDLVDVDDGRAVDDDVVDDAWPAPAGP